MTELNFHTEDEINVELSQYKLPKAFQNIKGYPIEALDDRPFEILMYILFQSVIKFPDRNKLKIIENNFDRIHLCKGIKDRGRDSILSNSGKNNGVIQCKRYTSTSIAKPLAAKEIIKFCLNSLFDDEFIEVQDNFYYFFVTSNTFTEPTKTLLSDFKLRIFKESKLNDWISEVVSNNAEINKVYNENSHLQQLFDAIKKINVIYIDRTIIDEYITYYEDIIAPSFFQIKSVIEKTHIMDEFKQIIYKKENDSKQIDIDLLNSIYFKYLQLEFGSVYFDGLPADNDLSNKVNIENLYVPLSFKFWNQETKQSKLKLEIKDKLKKNLDNDFDDKFIRYGIDVDSIFLANRSVILGLPGSGKSMLLKSIVLYLSSSTIQEKVNFHINSKSFPILIRCRDFDFSNIENFTSILFSLFEKSELLFEYKNDFKKLINDYISTNKLIILVDGLDEIPDSKNRIKFIQKLRSFMETYPKIKFIITSRETGYRVLGSSLMNHCYHFEIEDFDDFQIESLITNWYKIVYGNSKDKNIEANELAKSISKHDRIKKIAKNPLLLTTLLLVKRWVGHLPTRRSILYDKAIEVLLMTWNIESYQVLEKDQVLPQLSYLAYYMMISGEARIGVTELKKVLHKARELFPEIEYTTSVNELIEKIEMRSSLLVQIGYDTMNGLSEAMYEFRHLTFQEFLTAYAIKEGFLPNNIIEEKAKYLNPFLFEERWKETILLYNVLSGRECKKLINLIIENLQNTNDELKIKSLVDILFNSLIDEVQIGKDSIEVCIDYIVKYFNLLIKSEQVSLLLLFNRYKEIFDNVLLNYLGIDVLYSQILKSMFSVNFNELVSNDIFFAERINFLDNALNLNNESINRSVVISMQDIFYTISLSKFQLHFKKTIIDNFLNKSYGILLLSISNDKYLEHSLKALQHLSRLLISLNIRDNFNEILKLLYKQVSCTDQNSELFILLIHTIARLPFTTDFSIDFLSNDLVVFAKKNINSEDKSTNRFSNLYLFLIKEIDIKELIFVKSEFNPEDKIFSNIINYYMNI